MSGSSRQRIFENAIVLMRDQGFHGTSIQDVANKLQFTKAAFYYYVKNKEDLLYEISVQTLRLMVSRIDAISTSDDSPAEKMRAIIDSYVRLITDEPALFIVYFREKRFLSPKHLREVNAAERRILHALEHTYREGVRKKQFRKLDPAVAVLGILGMCFWIFNWYEPSGALSGSSISNTLQTIALSGILIQEVNSSRSSERTPAI